MRVPTHPIQNGTKWKAPRCSAKEEEEKEKKKLKHVDAVDVAGGLHIIIITIIISSRYSGDDDEKM